MYVFVCCVFLLGVGYSWIDGLKDYAEKTISDQRLAMAAHAFPENTPQTKEAYGDHPT